MMVEAHTQESQNPLHHREFRKLFAAQVIALTGTGLSTVALTLLAYDMVGGNAAAVLGSALACKMLAYVFFAPVVGGLAHRFARKPFLITMDIIRAGLVLLMPFVTEVWQIYALVFTLNLFSAGFTPVFAATIPDLLTDEPTYTRALSLSRLAYDLENLLSPVIAGIALLSITYSGLFAANSFAFACSAALIVITTLPPREKFQRGGSVWQEISFGTVAYLKTPRLRGLFALYLGVAAASAMIIVNTIVYMKDSLGLTSTHVAFALAASGGGSMIAALSLPRLLNKVADRPVMLFGGGLMALGVALISTGPDFIGVISTWFLIGIGWSLVQTPAGRVVTRSSRPTDRTAFFSAQFALSHAGWLVFYPIAGQLGARLGVETTALILAGAISLFTLIASRLWPRQDIEVLVHEHQALVHSHLHTHDQHHQHHHDTTVSDETEHAHEHRHESQRHAHPFVIDDHHKSWPTSSTP